MKFILLFIFIASSLFGEEVPLAFDAQKESSIEGVVTHVAKSKGVSEGGELFLTIESSERKVLLLLAPLDYLQRSGFSVNIGDRIKALGIHIVKGERNYFIVSSVSINGRSLDLIERPSLKERQERGDERGDPP